MKPSSYRDRVVDVIEEYYKFHVINRYTSLLTIEHACMRTASLCFVCTYKYICCMHSSALYYVRYIMYYTCIYVIYDTVYVYIVREFASLLTDRCSERREKRENEGKLLTQAQKEEAKVTPATPTIPATTTSAAASN